VLKVARAAHPLELPFRSHKSKSKRKVTSGVGKKVKSSRKSLANGVAARATQNSRRQQKTWPKPAGDGVERGRASLVYHR